MNFTSKALIGLAVIITLAAMVVTEEDWRGKHAWETYRHEWEAKGEKFYGQAFAPPAVPDNENFFSSPILSNLLSGKINFSPYPKSDKSYPFTNGNWEKMTVTDLRPWQAAYRNLRVDDNGAAFPVALQPQTPAADVLFALSKYDSAVEELRQASLRPYANAPVHYENGINEAATTLLPQLAVLKRCAQVLDVRAIAELADGQNDRALDDTKLLMKVSNALRNSPLLISQLVRMAMMNFEIQAIYEGLAEHKWSDGQLVILDSELAKLDYLADYEFAMRGERACAIDYFENLRRTREMINYDPLNGGLVTNRLTVVPSAYFYQNELAFAQINQQWLLPMVDTQARMISPTAVRHADEALQAEQKSFSPYRMQALMTVSAIDRAVTKFAYTQSSIDLARVACELERYRLAHGEYPESLDMLAPQFMARVPHDIINGQPLHYRRNPDGQFVLYSVGWNETDDGGQIILNKQGTVDRDKGDWVWEYPGK